MSAKPLKYLSVLTFPFLVYLSFTSSGWICFLPIIYAFGVIPILEIMLGADASNASQVEEELRKSDALYDFMLYLIVPVHLGFFIWFLFSISSDSTIALSDFIGRSLSMGLLCGLFGINVAHELGHRVKSWEQMLAKTLLMSTQYTHFFIEHNEGHHKHVSTPEDPASARFGENLYSFVFRSITGSYLSAWKIEKKRLTRKKMSFWSFRNRMLTYTLAQALILALVFFGFGWMAFTAYLIASVSGIVLLETINYIEHYGLERRKLNDFRYEDATPQHSWNSDHVVGRLMLFELSRHSDHHANPARKYQILRHHDDSPQMPTGYPGMMVLATIPPLWFKVMNPLVNSEREDFHREFTSA